jgi:hypothetical protein
MLLLIREDTLGWTLDFPLKISILDGGSVNAAGKLDLKIKDLRV